MRKEKIGKWKPLLWKGNILNCWSAGSKRSMKKMDCVVPNKKNEPPCIYQFVECESKSAENRLFGTCEKWKLAK